MSSDPLGPMFYCSPRNAVISLQYNATLIITGERCQLPPDGVNPEVICGDVICLNGGVCAVVEQGPVSTRCFCEAGFSGRACEIREPCALNPCRGRGNCINTETSFRCNCLAPYTGGYNCKGSFPLHIGVSSSVILTLIFI